MRSKPSREVVPLVPWVPRVPWVVQARPTRPLKAPKSLPNQPCPPLQLSALATTLKPLWTHDRLHSHSSSYNSSSNSNFNNNSSILLLLLLPISSTLNLPASIFLLHCRHSVLVVLLRLMDISHQRQ